MCSSRWFIILLLLALLPLANQPAATAATPSPTQAPTRTPIFPLPSGEIAFFEAIKNTVDYSLALKDLNPSGKSRTLYASGHEARPDIPQGLSWSPDGQKLIFGMDGDNIRSDIYLLTIGASEPVNLTKTMAYDEKDPAISPDGRRVAFVSGRRKGAGFFLDLYSMRIDGGGARLLLECSELCHHPDWSPDGKQLVFQMGKDLYLIPAGGGKAQKLTSGGVSQFPAWSPDGEWIAFQRQLVLSANTGGAIYRIHPDGSGFEKLTPDSFHPGQLTWSPDGQFLAFENSLGMPGYKIVALHIESKRTYGLARIAYAPAWRPGSQPKPPTPAATTAASGSDCTAGWTRLKIGERAKVSGKPGDPSNRVRLLPNLTARQVGLLQPGQWVKVLAGPECIDGLVWWQVSATGLPNGIGWTAEGDGKAYWLEPFP